MDKMTKKIKFALEQKDGEEIRTMSELKEQLKKNFDSSIIEWFYDGEKKSKLAQWLEDHYHQEEAEKINELWEEYDRQKENLGNEEFKNWLVEGIYSAFELPLPDDKSILTLDLNQFETLQDKKDYLDSKIADENTKKYLAKYVSQVVRNQNELEKMVNYYIEKKNYRQVSIFLLNDENKRYVLNLKYLTETNIIFVGVNNDNEDEIEIEIRKDVDGENVMWTRDEFNKFFKKEENQRRFSNLTIWVTKITKSFIGGDEKEPESISMKKLDFQGAGFLKKGLEDSIEVVQDRLFRYMDAGFPLIYLNTFEEDKADEIICNVATERTIYEWNVEGFFEKESSGQTSGRWKEGWSLKETLNMMISEQLRNLNDEKSNTMLKRSVVVLKDSHNQLHDEEIVAKLKYTAQLIYNGKIQDCNIIIVSPILKIPVELENYISVVNLGNLTSEEIKELIKEFCQKQETDLPEDEVLEKLTVALRGLSEFDIINILSLAISGDSELQLSDIALIRDQKKQMIKKTNVLEMIEVKENLEDIGGLEILTEWLANKAEIFKKINEAREFGVKIPKGILIAGMPGCGKSLSAKVTAKVFDLPLLRMDMGRIMGKYVGESEANMRKAIKLSESISPCVLWIDEMEKAFAGIRGDGGGAEVTTRLFGTFLTWMQEKKSEVFVVATANNAMQLPPELLRKGRFDEVFYVDLPNSEERRKIFEIHVRKLRSSDWEILKDDMDEILKETKGYSGADIEGVVSEAVEYAFLNEKESLSKEILQEIISHTHSISKVQSGPISEMQKLYRSNKLKKASQMTAKDFDRPDERLKHYIKKFNRMVKEKWIEFRNRKNKVEEAGEL